MRKPNVNSAGEMELEKAGKQLDAFENQLNDLTLDVMNQAPKLEVEPQTKMAQKDIADAKDIYLKPKRSVASREKFNEDFRSDYNFAKEYVYFIAENKEIIGESITMWTKPFAGIPAEEWSVPVNKPIWAPRYVAERVKGCSYHQLSMTANPSQRYEADAMGEYCGTMVAKNTVQRLDAMPATKQRSIFMGKAAGF